MNHSRLAIVVLLILSISSLSYGKSAPPGNLQLNASVDLHIATIKIHGISEKSKTPLNAVLPKQTNGRFIIVDSIVLSIQEGAELISGNFCLTSNSGTVYPNSGAYGKIDVFGNGNLSNFEATDGAVIYAREKDDELNIFFEVPQNVPVNELELSYKIPDK